MILAILFAYFGYKKANDSGRNGILWAIIALFAFIGSQLVTGFLLGFGLIIAARFFGWSENIIDENELIFNIVGIVVGIVSGYLVLIYLDKVPLKGNYSVPPPPDFKG